MRIREFLVFPPQLITGFIVVTDIVLSPIFTESGYIKSDIAVTDLFLLLTVLQP